MKRLLALLLAVLLLAGCTPEDPQSTTAPAEQTVPTTQPVQTTLPGGEEAPGLYIPDSQAELLTAGALRQYSLEYMHTMGVVPMGNDILLFSGGMEDTVLTRLAGERCVVKATASISSAAWPGSPGVRVSGDRVVYYDEYSGSIVYLNGMLQEMDRVALPEEVTEPIVLGEDLQTVYYCVKDRLYVLDLQTGILRLLRQQACQLMVVKQELFGGAVLECFVYDADGNGYSQFLSTQTGEILGRDSGLRSLDASGDRYILQRADGFLDEVLFGTLGGELKCFNQEVDAWIYPLPGMNAVLSVRTSGAGQILSCFELESGRRTASVTLPGDVNMISAVSDTSGDYVWLMAYDTASGSDVLYRWELAESAVVNYTVHTDKRYTAENPDTQGIGELQAAADTMAERYGVEIFLGNAVTQPGDYTLTPEHRVAALKYGLDQLERALSAFPAGFLERTVEQTTTGVLRIGLVREISDDNVGLQYWLDGDAYIAVKIGSTMEQTVYHEVSHVLDNFIIANSYAYDDWEELSPRGFTYDYNYVDYRNRTDSTYLEGEDRAFVDNYSKSYPKEDRARILEYAMMPGNEAVFASKYMQQKLLKICEGIRQCFGLKKSAETYIWEQYLETSLAYTKK